MSQESIMNAIGAADAFLGSSNQDPGTPISAAATAITTLETYRALPVPDRPYTEEDVQVLAEILRLAERGAETETGSAEQITLLQLITAYEIVLRKIGLEAAEDVFYYRFLLKLALDPSGNWWVKFRREVEAEGLSYGDERQLGMGNPMSAQPQSSSQQPEQLQEWQSPAQAPAELFSLEAYAPPLSLHNESYASSVDYYDRGRFGDPSRDPIPLRSYFGPSRTEMAPPPVAEGSSSFRALEGDAVDTGGPVGDSPSQDLLEIAGMMDDVTRTVWGGPGRGRGRSSARDHAVENWMVALSFWECRTCQRLLRRWRDHRRGLVGDAVWHWREWSARRAFECWRDAVRSGWEGTRHACSHHDAVIGRGTLRTWRQIAKEQRWLRLNLEAGLRAAAFQGWHEAAALQAAMRRASEKVRGAALRRLQKEWWGQWRGAFLQTAMHRRILYGALTGSAHKAKGAALSAWRDLTKQQQLLRQRIVSRVMELSYLQIVVGLVTWLASMAVSPEHMAQVQVCVRRLRRLMLSGCFWWWMEWATQRGTRLGKMRRTIGHLSNLRAGWAFSGWKAKTEKMAADKQKVFKSLGRIKHRALATGFDGWLHNVQETRRQLKLVERAVKHMVHRVLADSLYTWKSWVDTKLEHEGKIMTVLEKAMHMLENKAFQGWVDFMIDRQYKIDALEKAILHMGHASLARAINGWVYAVEMRIYELGLVERALSYFSLSFLHRAFDGWADSVQHRREQMALALRAARKLLHSRTHAAFQGWVYRVNETARQLDVVDRCFKRIRNKELSAAFSGWSRAAYMRQIARGKVAANVAKITGSRHLAAWNAWVAFKEESKAKRAAAERAVRHMRNGAVSKAWTRWVGFMVETWRMQELVEKAVGRWDNRLCSAAFARWKEMVAERHSQMELAARSLAKLMRGRQAQAFERWLEFMGELGRQKASLRHAANHFANSLFAMAFWTWVAWKEQKLDNFIKANRALGFMRSRTLSMAWQRWLEFVAEVLHHKLTADRAVGYWRNRHFGPAFAAWVGWWRSRIHKKDQVLHAVLHWREMFLGSAFFGWCFSARHMADKKDKAFAAVLHWRNQQLAYAFVGWQEGASLSVLKKERVAKALSFWRNQSIGAALLGWRFRASDLVSKREQVSRSLVFWRNRFLASAMEGWKYRTRDLKEKFAKATRALAHWRNAELRRGLNALVDNVVQAYNGARALERWSNITYVRVLESWRDVVRKQRKALLRWTNACLGKALYAWYSWWERQVYLWGVLERCAARLRNRQLSMAFDSWAAVWEQAAENTSRADEIRGRVILRMQNQLASAAFSALKGHQQKLASLRGILMRVQSREASMSFNSWRAYCEKMGEVRDLLRRVLGGLLESAFFSWRLVTEELVYERQSQEFIEEQVKGNRQLREFAACSLARWSRLTETLAWEQWTYNAFTARDMRRKLEAAFKRYYYSVAERAFMVLRENAAHRKSKKRKLLMAVSYWGGKETFLVFRMWREATQEQAQERMAMVKAIFSFSINIKRKALLDWRHETEFLMDRRRKLHWALSQMDGYRLRLFFEVWQGVASELAGMEARLGGLLRRVMGSHLRNAWDAWCNVLDWKAWLDGCNTVALRHFSNRMGLRALLAWREVTDELVRYSAIINYCLPRQNQFLLASSFYAWHDVLLAFRKLRFAAHAFASGLLGKAFRQWYRTWREARIRRAVAWSSISITRRGFEGWLGAAATQRAKREAFAARQAAIKEAVAYGDSLARERRYELVETVLIGWRMQAGLYREVRKKLLQRTEAKKSAVFAEWAALMRDSDIREKQIRADKMSSLYRKLWSFRRWRERVYFSGQRAEVLRAAFKVIMQADELEAVAWAMSRWKEYAAYRRAVNLRAYGHVKHQRKRVLQDFLMLWANYCRAMRRDEPLETRGTRALQAVRHIARSVSPVKDRRSAAALRLAKGSSSPGRSRRPGSPGSADEWSDSAEDSAPNSHGPRGSSFSPSPSRRRAGGGGRTTAVAIELGAYGGGDHDSLSGRSSPYRRYDDDFDDDDRYYRRRDHL